MFVNTVFDIKDGLKSGKAYFGKFELDDIILSQAISQSKMRVDCLETSIYRCPLSKRALEYNFYPKGKLICGCCKEIKEVSKTQPTFAVYKRSCNGTSTSAMIIHDSLICLPCRNKIGATYNRSIVRVRKLFLQGETIPFLRKQASDDTMFAIRCITRRWRKRTVESIRVKEALATLRGPIMKWACKPTGALYRLAMMRLITNSVVYDGEFVGLDKL
jgi:hypothetical protein